MVELILHAVGIQSCSKVSVRLGQLHLKRLALLGEGIVVSQCDFCVRVHFSVCWHGDARRCWNHSMHCSGGSLPRGARIVPVCSVEVHARQISGCLCLVGVCARLWLAGKLAKDVEKGKVRLAIGSFFILNHSR